MNIRPINYTEMISFRAASTDMAVLEEIIKSGKASDISTAVRYCIKSVKEASA